MTSTAFYRSYKACTICSIVFLFNIFYIKPLIKRLKMLILICLLILLIKNNALVFEGATTGLMLWFHNVIPLLLPFMLLSRLLVCSIYKKNYSGKAAILMTLLSGLLCGYPIGAYTTASCLKNNLYKKKTAELLLPLCNNASPMFISGFILQKTLNNTVSLPAVLAVLYLPYVIYILISVLCHNYKNAKTYFHTAKHTSDNENPNIQNRLEHTQNTVNKINENSTAFDIAELIFNINSIGVYIIICSVATELLLAAGTKAFALGYITVNQNAFISTLLSSIEITRGVELIAGFNFYNTKKITALILALTSFGGISSILQTGQVIHNSGLSIKKYIFVKLICGCASYLLASAIL